MITVIIVIVGISLLIIIHEIGHFGAAKFFGILVEEFGFGFPPKIISKKVGETRYSLNWIPIGGFVKLHGEFDIEKQENNRSFVRQKPWKRAIVLVAGVVMNFFFGWLLLSLVFFIGSPTGVFVNKVLPDSAAVAAGILAGDRVDGFSSAKDFTEFISRHRGQIIQLSIIRQSANGAPEKIEITTPVIKENLGVMIVDFGLPPQSLPASLKKGFVMAVAIVGNIFIALGSIFSTPQNFVGPVGIIDVAVQTGKLGLIYVVQLLALISLNLAVLNILPIPALDGGRLAFLIIEKIKGSPITPQREIFWNTAGFIFIICLIVLVTAVDIARFFG